MKKKSWKQALSMLLAVALMATLLVVPAGAATEATSYTYTLDFASVTLSGTTGTTAAGTTTEGEGTPFTIINAGASIAEKTGVTFDNDGTPAYTASRVYQPSSNASASNIKKAAGNGVYFSTQYPNATVKIWWGRTGTKRSLMHFYGASLDKLAEDALIVAEAASSQTAGYCTTMTLADAGVHAFGFKNDAAKVQLYKIEVVDTKPATYDITGTPTGDENASVTFKDADGKAITEAAAGTVVTVVAEGTGRYVPKTYTTDDDATTVGSDNTFTMPAKNITVTVAFEEESAEALFAAAREKLTESVLNYTVDQATANTEADVKANVEAKLEEALTGTGVTATVTTTGTFKAATGSAEMDATEENNGSYTYSVALAVGEETEGESAEAITGTVTIEATTKPYTQDTLGAAVSAAKAKLLAYGAGETAADVFAGHIVVEPATMKALTDVMSAAQVVVNKKETATTEELKTQTKALTQAVADFETAVEGKTAQGTKTDAGLKVLTGDAYKASSDTADGYFTVSAPTLTTSGAGVFTDGYAAGENGSNGYRFPMATDSTIKFTVTAGSTANLRVYWVCNDNTAGITLTPTAGTTAGGQSSGVTKNFPAIATWSGLTGGTEYTIKGKQYIFRVEVEEILPAQASAATFEAMTAEHYGSFGWDGMPATIGDMQTDVAFAADANAATTIKASGTLKYVTGFTGFNGSDVAEQSGNYVALELNRPSSITGVTSTVKVPAKGVADAKTITLPEDDGNLSLIFRVSSTSANPVIKVDWDGEGEAYTETAYTLDFSGLTLEKPASVTPVFTSEGAVSQLTSKTDKEVAFTLSNASTGDYVLYDAAGNKACSADSVKADNGVITFTLSTALDPATADSTDDVKYTVKVTDDADHGQSAAAEVTVKRYIPVDSITLTHFTADGADSEVSGTVNHVLYEKLNDGDADVTGSTENPNPSYPNAWKLAPIVKGPGDKTPTDPRVTFSNLKATPEFISVAADGTVTALKAGTGRVRVASVADPEKYVGFNMTVKVRIGSIDLYDGASNLDDVLLFAGQVGQKRTLSAKVTTSAGGKNPNGSDNNTYQAVKWTSSDPTVATVNETTGEVTMVGLGSTNITATSTVDPTVSKSKELNVVKYSILNLAIDTPNKTWSAAGTGDQKVRLTVTGVPEAALEYVSVACDDTNITVTKAENATNIWEAALPANDSQTDAVEYTFTVTFDNDSAPYWEAATNTATVKVTVAAQDTHVINVQLADPNDRTLTVGDALNFTVNATLDGAASDNLEYQWYKGDTAIEGATESTYSVAAVTKDDAGAYKCEVSVKADAGVTAEAVTSKVINVTVNDPALASIDVALTAADGLTYTDGNLAIVGPVPAVFTITTTPDGHKDTVKSTVAANGTAIVGAVVEGNKLTITPKTVGTTTVTLAGTTAADVTKVITVTVTKAAAPAALTADDYTVTQPTADVATGSITITQTAPEGTEYVYRLGDSGDWLKFPTDTKTVSGLVPGIYKIRVFVPNPALQNTTNGVPVEIKAYEAPVTVTAVAITTEANSVAVEGTLQLTASITTSDNKTNAATAADVTWSVENGTGSATVSNGVLTGVTEGTVTVKVTSVVDGTKFATKTITVTPKTVSRYNVTVTGGTFTVNDVAALTAAAGDTVKATASVPAGKVFDKWTATGITLTADQAASNPLTFTMPGNVVELTASFKDQTVTPVDKTALTAAITAAEAVDVTGVKVSEDGADVPTTEKWIAKSVKDAFDAALADAKAVADDADQATVDAAATALTEATTALTEAIENAQKGTKPVDKADLTAAIEAAEAKMEGVLTSTNGKDIDTDKTWVTKAVMDDLTKAVADAKAVVEKEDATETELTEAAEALAAASEAFVPAAGTKTSTPIRPSHGGGSVSTPVSDKKTETLPDGTKRETETAKDGTVTVTDTLSDGTKTVTVTTPEGESTTTVTLGRGTESVQVTIPVEDATSGMVAVIVKPDGTEEIIRDSAVVNGEVVFELDKDATVKVVDKTKSFVDVPGHWAESDVNFVAARDLFNGVSSTHFAPDATMTRGMMATVLFRLDGETKADKAVDFSDVTVDDWFAEAVDWAAEEGVITGYTDGSFGPDRSITREELVVMIYRYAGASAVEGNDLEKFDDADAVSDWATAAMTWAVQNGIIQGKGNNVLDPKGNASRAEVSAVLQRYVRLSK